MKEERDTAEILGSGDGFDDIELSEDGRHERTLPLKGESAWRKVHLMARGAKEVRCAHCGQIRPIAGAVESEEGWICEDCIPILRFQSTF